MNNKNIPAALPDHLRLPSFSSTYPTSLIPGEMFCQRCAGNVPLSDPLLITSKAKILTNTRVIHDVATYSKCCHQCGIHYRYQEWKDGLHNFNDSIILDLPLCLHIRNMLQATLLLEEWFQCLELTIGEQFPPAKTVLHAYLHFEALTSDSFVKKQSDNPFTVDPSYHLWAPWIGRNARKSNQCLNTEFQKIHQPKEAELCEITVSEDRLKNELYKKKVSVIRKLCKECGVDSIGSKSDLLERLSSEMKSRQTMQKYLKRFGVPQRKAKISLPWLNVKKQVPDSHGHPITGSAEHYALNDKFHEENSKDKRDVLRKTGLVAQLAGKVNSQVAEQFFSKLKKNNYFLNMTLPSTHVFLMRTTSEITETTKSGATNDHQVTKTNADVSIEEEDEPMIVENADEESAQPWKTPHNSVQEKLLRYILDTERLADEVIVKEGATCLTRADFWTLGLRREMESDIGNACMKLIYEEARAHGKDIYIADMYIVATWKSGKKSTSLFSSEMPLCSLHGHKLPAQIIISYVRIARRLDPGQWTEATGLDIGVLPQQTNSNDCGVFMLMYALYTVLDIPFNFSQLDMPAIREWWCLRLIERFETEGYGKRVTKCHPTRRWWTLLWHKREQITTFSLSSVAKRNQSGLTLFSKCSVKTVPVQVYIDNQEQVDAIYSHLSSILDSTPMHMHSDKVKFIMDVLFPEVVNHLCSCFVENLSILEAEEKFLRGPVIDLSEREHFDRRIEQHLKKIGKQVINQCHT
ncbi:hypothetical protein QQF64_002944 [Cirrhinus molitorella]|uniref:SAP domain-containing protein n=1 Tax=Cirrhinus molitorella TaxID=172907 RepID=A0ABR3MRK4_9TELE